MRLTVTIFPADRNQFIVKGSCRVGESATGRSFLHPSKTNAGPSLFSRNPGPACPSQGSVFMKAGAHLARKRQRRRMY
jgi:hypothetical protein